MSDRAGSNSAAPAAVGFDSAIHNMIAKQNEQAVISKPKDSEDIERKKAILAQYAELSDGEEYLYLRTLVASTHGLKCRNDSDGQKKVDVQ